MYVCTVSNNQHYYKYIFQILGLTAQENSSSHNEDDHDQTFNKELAKRCYTLKINTLSSKAHIV